MKKRVLAILMSLVMVLTLLPVSALAAEGETKTLDITNGSITITANGYQQSGAASETSYTGSYTISGTATNTITIKSGTCNLTISGLNITATNAPAIRVENGAKLNLTVVGGKHPDRRPRLCGNLGSRRMGW